MPDTAGALPIQLICTDFDGTIFAPHDDPPVPMVLQRMVGELQERGARWVINTGRDLPSMIEVLASLQLAITPDYLVVMERDIYRRKLDSYVGLEDWNRTCAETHTALFARVRRDMPRLLKEIAGCCSAAIYEDPRAPFSFVSTDGRETRGMQEYLEDYCRTVPGLAVVQSHDCTRFSHERYNKGTALAEIGRCLGMGRDVTFVAGDHFNDLPMMSKTVARWLVAPANAIEAVKDTVRRQRGYVSHQPCGFGVARGLEFFLGGDAAGLVAGLTLVGELGV